MEIVFSKFEVDLMIEALDRAATRFESRASVSRTISTAREHDIMAGNMRRLKHRLLTLRYRVHEAERQRWNEIGKKGRRT
jgi:hypothetical protein